MAPLANISVLLILGTSILASPFGSVGSVDSTTSTSSAVPTSSIILVTPIVASFTPIIASFTPIFTLITPPSTKSTSSHKSSMTSTKSTTNSHKSTTTPIMVIDPTPASTKSATKSTTTHNTTKSTTTKWTTTKVTTTKSTTIKSTTTKSTTLKITTKSTTTSTFATCSTNAQVANFDVPGTHITPPAIIYQDLTYDGFVQATVSGNTIKPASAPDIITFKIQTDVTTGLPSTVAGPGVTYYSLSSVRYACINSLGKAIDCTIRTTGKTNTGATVSADMAFNGKDGTATQMGTEPYPAAFSKVKSVTFEIVGGTTGVDYTVGLDNLVYITYTCTQ